MMPANWHCAGFQGVPNEDPSLVHAEEGGTGNHPPSSGVFLTGVLPEKPRFTVGVSDWFYTGSVEGDRIGEVNQFTNCDGPAFLTCATRLPRASGFAVQLFHSAREAERVPRPT